MQTFPRNFPQSFPLATCNFSSQNYSSLLFFVWQVQNFGDIFKWPQQINWLEGVIAFNNEWNNCLHGHIDIWFLSNITWLTRVLLGLQNTF
jgi:hypothetical protein